MPIVPARIRDHTRMPCAGFRVALIALAVLILAPIRTSIAAPLLSSPYPFATGQQPQGIAVGDFNRDGKPDIVTVNSLSNTISVLLGNGDGTFQGKHDYAVGTSPVGVCTAWLCGTSSPPGLVVTNSGANSVSFLLGNGDGTFTPVTVASDLVPLGIATATPSWGGPYLFAACRNSNDIDLYLSRCSHPPWRQGTLALSGSPLYVAAGITGVGDSIEVLATVPASNAVQWFKIDSRLAQHPQADLHTGASPAGLALGALIDGNSNLDLVVANSQDGTISFFRGDNGLGTTPPAVFPAGPYPLAVSLADVNGDGRADVIVTHQYAGSISVLLNRGDGTFGAPDSFRTGEQPIGVAAGDFNGDGKTDLATTQLTENRISVLLGLGQGAFPGFEGLAANANPTGVALGDLNHDGHPDLAVLNPSNNSVSVLLNRGDGTYAPKTDYAVVTQTAAVALGDLNGDGNPDMVTLRDQSPHVSVFLGNQDGTFGSRQDYLGAGLFRSLVLADMDGDGHLDAVTTRRTSSESGMSIAYGVGDGSFGRTESHAYDNNVDDPVSLAVGDLNGDGHPDVVVADSLLNEIAVFEQPFTNPPLTYLVHSGPSSVSLADMNGDGLLDIVFTCAGDNTVTVRWNNGDGTFGATPAVATGLRPAGVAVADVNGDGHPDAIVTDSGDNTVCVCLNDGHGSLRPASGFYYGGAGPAAIATGDLNGDGLPDFVVCDAGSTVPDPVLVLFGIGPSATSSAVPPPAGGTSAFLPVEAYPNPAVGAVIFRLNVPAPGPVRLSIYDVTGRERAILADGARVAEGQVFTWDGRDGTGRAVAPGVYFARVATPQGTRTSRFVIVR